jgi:hypothetical protein
MKHAIVRATGEAYDKVKIVFKELRKKEFIARMNYMCCSSCASYNISSALDKNLNKKYGAYFHKQTTEHYNESGLLYIYFFGDTDLFTETAGSIIVNELSKVNAIYSWNGKSGSAISVYDNQEVFDKFNKPNTIPGMIIEGE